MNSEISTIMKMSPVTNLKKTEKPIDDQVLSTQNVSHTNEPANIKATETQLNSTIASLNAEEKAKQKSPKSIEQLKQSVDQGNSLLQAVRRNLQFQVDETTQELVVKIVDSDSGNVVRQIPSEEMLAFIRRLQELEGQQGSMIQDQA